MPCRIFALAPEMNHYYASYDDRDGITVLFEHTENADIAMAQGPGDVDALGRPCDPALRGLYGMPMSPDRTCLVHFDPESGKTRQHRAELRQPELLWNRQLNAMDWSKPGLERRTRHHMVYQGFRPEGITQKMLRVYGERVDSLAVAGRGDAGPRRQRRRAGPAHHVDRRARRGGLPELADLRAATAALSASRGATTATWCCRC